MDIESLEENAREHTTREGSNVGNEDTLVAAATEMAYTIDLYYRIVPWVRIIAQS